MKGGTGMLVRGSWVEGVRRRCWPCLWLREGMQEDLGGGVYVARAINVHLFNMHERE
jgi:hypothetical protein